jgi:SfnB family sulfur acquisition oxidoreductase
MTRAEVRSAVASRQQNVPALSADEAVAVAREHAAEIATGSAQRDSRRILPVAEVWRLADSGLLAITVPQRYGGAGLPPSVAAEVFRILASGDPNVAQIPHSHFVYLNQAVQQGSEEQKQRIFGEVLAGRTIGNAQSERGTSHVRDFRTTLRPHGPGRWRLDGTKFYSTGALLADRIAVLAHLDVDGPMAVAWVDREAPGVEVLDDWDAVGQRTTASGTVRLSGVEVTDDWITPYAVMFDGPQTYGAYAQLLHAAIDAGIARAALGDAAEFVRTKSRPYPDAQVARAADDPLVVHAFGEMELAVRSAEAVLAEAGRALDRAVVDPTEASAGDASLAVAAARAATTSAAVEVSSRLFEVSGTRSVLAELDLDRHWRNARTHTLHDPAAWKIQHLGRWAIDGQLPPRHGQI